jgi:hypothetical protein
VVTLFYQTVIDHVYFYEIKFAKLIIRYPKRGLLNTRNLLKISILDVIGHLKEKWLWGVCPRAALSTV